mmetsp:Transcript_135715/g.378081  ORF Transcript_135715/g.378081 Transcript_135715/m.378081 type:complete len:329 (-) Transcript_135715:122-1108(-)
MPIECGVYFTSSPGYSCYGSGAEAAQEDRAKRGRLHDFWGADVDDAKFFLQKHTQQLFRQLFASLCAQCQLDSDWEVLFGQGPFGEAGGLCRCDLREEQVVEVHSLAGALGFLLQQTTLYYYIGDKCFVSRCRGPWSNVRSERPAARDWTAEAASAGAELASVRIAEVAVGQGGREHLTTVYQPRMSESDMAMRQLDDPLCKLQARVTLAVELTFDRPIDCEELWDALVRDVRANLPEALRRQLDGGLPAGVEDWVSSSAWSDSVWILRAESSSSVRCRREVHPWYDSHAEHVVPIACTLAVGAVGQRMSATPRMSSINVDRNASGLS